MQDPTGQISQEQERDAQGAGGASRQPPGPAAQPPLSLTSEENNCNSPSRGILYGPRRGGGVAFMRPPCNTWTGCTGSCAAKKAARVEKGIARVAAAEKLTRFLTLTLDPKKRDGKSGKLVGEMSTPESLVYIQQCWKKFQVAVHRRCAGVRYVRIPELQGNGRAHLHVPMNKWIPHRWLQKQWEAVGGGHQVNVKHVDAHRMARYCAPYLRKGAQVLPAGVRRFSASVGMKLMEKQGEPSGWKFLRGPSDWLFERESWTVDCEAGVERFLSGRAPP